jgi:hypothetical protein
VIPNAAEWLRRRAALAGILVAAAAGTIQYREVFATRDPGSATASAKKGPGPFYLGVRLPRLDSGGLPPDLKALESRLGVGFSVVSLDRVEGPEILDELSAGVLDRGRVPMIAWAPWTTRRGAADVRRASLDDDLRVYADRLRDLGGPVLLRFAPRPDEPGSPWSGSGGMGPSEYRALWRRAVRAFQERGASNVGWVWTPGASPAASAFYPGDELVDWIAADLGGAAHGCERRQFSELYAPLRPRLLAHDKPVLVSDVVSTPCGDAGAWYLAALADIRSSYPEVRGLVTGDGWRAGDWSAASAAAIAAELGRMRVAAVAPPAGEPRPASHRGRTPAVRGAPGAYELIVDGRPFYVRGVAYSPDDWREGSLPLSRRRIEADLDAIRAMGANTIRRYGTGWYDHNVLTVAHEKDLKVLMGFWLAPDVDYLEDRDAVRAYETQVVKTVEALHKYPAVLGWVLGNETWGHLGRHFHQPRLTAVRRAYAELVERLAVRIHEIDPSRPVMTALEHTAQFPGELREFARFAPSLDVIGVNTYYEARFAALSATVESFDPGRPYLASEFGTDGYWDHELSERQADGLLRERPGSAKAEQYATAWTRFIAPDRGRNVGGIAYCWRERLEGTATWFGLTDARDRRMPAYFALRAAWTGEPAGAGPRISSIESRARHFEPEEAVDFRADVPAGDGLVFEWSLRGDELQDADAGLEPLDGGRSVRVRLPREPGAYRLYVHASGGDGRVDSASLAFHVAPRARAAAHAFGEER